VHPLPRRSDIAVECSARLIGRREVRSSNGEIEQRYVIDTAIRIGERQWRIEVTLANRDMMSYRMLLGRQAIPRDGLVKPSASFLQPKLHYKIYEQTRR
jgi:ribosomal protein S6--L-glutamate ligase